MSLATKEPAVSRRTLALAGGVLWSLVGGFLILRAAIWLNYGRGMDYIMAAVAIFLGLLKGRFVFQKIVKKNLTRIASLSPHKEKICIFAFQAIASYLIALLMIGLGIALRMSPIPRDWLAALYILIGVALIRGALVYFGASRSM